MEPISAVTLSSIGGALGLIGTAVLFLDLRGDKQREQLADLDLYMGKLESVVKDMEKSPTPSGTLHGQDMAGIWKMMKEAAEKANEHNAATRLEIMEKMSAQIDKHRRATGIAIALVLLGGALQLVAAQM